MFHLTNVCRLCLSTKSDFKNMFNDDTIEKVTACIKDLEFDERYPTKVCKSCLKKIDKFFVFRNQCLKSEYIWNLYVNKLLSGKSKLVFKNTNLKVHLYRNINRLYKSKNLKYVNFETSKVNHFQDCNINLSIPDTSKEEKSNGSDNIQNNYGLQKDIVSIEVHKTNSCEDLNESVADFLEISPSDETDFIELNGSSVKCRSSSNRNSNIQKESSQSDVSTTNTECCGQEKFIKSHKIRDNMPSARLLSSKSSITDSFPNPIKLQKRKSQQQLDQIHPGKINIISSITVKNQSIYQSETSNINTIYVSNSSNTISDIEKEKYNKTQTCDNRAELNKKKKNIEDNTNFLKISSVFSLNDVEDQCNLDDLTRKKNTNVLNIERTKAGNKNKGFENCTNLLKISSVFSLNDVEDRCNLDDLTRKENTNVLAIDRRTKAEKRNEDFEEFGTNLLLNDVQDRCNLDEFTRKENASVLNRFDTVLPYNLNVDSRTQYEKSSSNYLNNTTKTINTSLASCPILDGQASLSKVHCTGSNFNKETKLLDENKESYETNVPIRFQDSVREQKRGLHGPHLKLHTKIIAINKATTNTQPNVKTVVSVQGNKALLNTSKDHTNVLLNGSIFEEPLKCLSAIEKPFGATSGDDIKNITQTTKKSGIINVNSDKNSYPIPHCSSSSSNAERYFNFTTRGFLAKSINDCKTEFNANQTAFQNDLTSEENENLVTSIFDDYDGID